MSIHTHSSPSWRLVKRDSFARTELHRKPVQDDFCIFCGSTGRLYEYRLETDGGRKFPIRGVYCSLGCFDAYNNSHFCSA